MLLVIINDCKYFLALILDTVNAGIKLINFRFFLFNNSHQSERV